jgi:hypothetical protein
MDMDFQDGYCDGLAGKGLQAKGSRTVVEFWQFVRGLALGSLDRITMTDRWFDTWAEGMGDGDA